MELILLIFGLFVISTFLYRKYLDMRNTVYLKQIEKVAVKINYHSPELLEMIGNGKEFNSLLFNDRGALIILDDRVDEFLQRNLWLSRYGSMKELLEDYSDFFENYSEFGYNRESQNIGGKVC